VNTLADVYNASHSLPVVPTSSTSIVVFVVPVVGGVALVLVLALTFFIYRRNGSLRRRLASAPRGHISIIFTDIQDSTRLWDAFPDDFPVALELHNKVIRSNIERYSGFEGKSLSSSNDTGRFHHLHHHPMILAGFTIFTIIQ
jgi:hypothetical protein